MIYGITASAFDLLHAGHIEMLRQAKSYCDYLTCCLHINPTLDRPNKNKPIQTIVERYIQLAAVSFVDEIIPYETEKDLKDILLIKKFNIRFLGEDYIGKKFTGDDLLNIKVIYTSRKHNFSTSELRKRIENLNYGNNNSTT